MTIGDTVLCLSTPELFKDEMEIGCYAPVKGVTYTVREVLYGGTSIYVKEIINPKLRYFGGISKTNNANKGEGIVAEPAWSVENFEVKIALL